MKKNFVGLLIFILGIFLIVGCSDTKKTPTKKIKANINENQKKKKQVKEKIIKKEIKKDTIVGSYQIIELKDGGETYNKKIIDSLNLDYSFEVKKDKTATMRFSDQEENLKYDDKYFKNEKQKIEYKYEDGKLVLFNEDTILTFKKK